MTASSPPPELPLALRRALLLRCPVCGLGRPYSGFLRMREWCPSCGFRFQRESGYYLGSIFVTYAVTVVLALIGYFALIPWLDPLARHLVLVPLAVGFPLWFFRHSRLLWLAGDLSLDPPRDEEFTDPETVASKGAAPPAPQS